MAEQPMSTHRIERELIGEPIAVGGHTIRPVVRLSGRVGGAESGRGSGGGGWLYVCPTEVVVREVDGGEYRVPIPNVAGDALRGMLTQSLAVAGICTAIAMGALLARALRGQRA